jgi:heat shock protein HspQ
MAPSHDRKNQGAAVWAIVVNQRVRAEKIQWRATQRSRQATERGEMNQSKYTVGQKVYRPAGDVLDTEIITRITTDLRDQHWYYTVTESGERRAFALSEQDIKADRLTRNHGERRNEHS